MTKKQSELFEDGEDDVVPEGIQNEEPEQPKPTKKPRKKRVLTEEQKEKLREQLARGRAKSLETRRRNKKIKDMEKEKARDAKDAELYEHLKKKKTKTEEGQKKIEDDNAALKKRLEEMEKKLMTLSSKPEPVATEPKLDVIVEKEEKKPPKNEVVETPKKERKPEKPAKTAKPVSPPPAPKNNKIHGSILPSGISLDSLRFM